MNLFSFLEPVQSLVAGIIVIGFGIIVGNIISVLIRKILEGFESERLLLQVGVKFPVVEFISSSLKYLIYLIGLIWGLTFLGLETIILYLVLFIILGLLILFILLSIKDTIPNFFSGLINYFTKKVEKGDYIVMESAEGRIVQINALEIKVRMKDGDTVIIPFTLINKKVITKKKK